ncbi:MAG: hypothetical protein ACHQHN_09300 [Sphingobacteriales bacterium]
MENLELSFYRKGDYKKSTTNSLIINLVVSAISFSLVTIKFDWIYGACAGIIIFIILVLKSGNRDRYFIYSISINSSEVELNYGDKEDTKTVKDDPKFFKFKKHSAFSRSRVMYLSVYYKGSLLLEQFESGTWDESKFNEVIDAASELNK